MEQRPLYEQRLWGHYHVIYEKSLPDCTQVLCKELVIEPGRNISYQRHFHRMEYWTIIDGEGELMLDRERSKVKRGDSIKVLCRQLHSIKATTRLRIIEVQMGDLLSEDDIERLPTVW